MLRGTDCWMYAAALIMRHCVGLCGALSSVGGAPQQNRGCHVEMQKKSECPPSLSSSHKTNV
jgi:hypothetical protein